MAARTPISVDDLQQVDEQVWRSIAGSFVYVPTVGTTVYYFPHGHAEHSTPVLDIDEKRLKKKLSLCRVNDIKLLANPESDEVFYKAQLVPVREGKNIPVQPGVMRVEERRAEYLSKTLTQSDANNGGGFSVPRLCAESILPGLDYSCTDLPSQMINVKDVHENNWELKHVYRGTPRRHLLSTGWSDFVNSKRLIAGDSVVFCKKRDEGSIHIGVRRGGTVYRRNGPLRVTPESVLKAIEKADSDAPFEVVYYPRWSSPFIVMSSVVENSMQEPWEAGTIVKMSMETDDPSRRTWHCGTVTSVKSQQLGLRSCTPWQLLEVEWEHPEVMKQRVVSPWQVVRVRQPYDHLNRRQNRRIRSKRRHQGFNVPPKRTIMLFVDDNDIPLGMQKARHGLVSSVSTGLSPMDSDSSQFFSPANFPDENKLPTSSCNHAPEGQNDGSDQQSEVPSSPSQTRSSITTKPNHCIALNLLIKEHVNSNDSYFMLFGHVVQPGQSRVSNQESSREGHST